MRMCERAAIVGIYRTNTHEIDSVPNRDCNSSSKDPSLWVKDQLAASRKLCDDTCLALACCTTLQVTRSNVIMRVPLFALHVLCLSILSAHVAVGQPCDLFVNSSDGADSNAGSQFAPLQSVEKAWSLSSSGQSICIAAGDYSAATGTLNLAGKQNISVRLTPFAGQSQIRLRYRSVELGGNVTVQAEPNTKLVFLPTTETDTESSKLTILDGLWSWTNTEVIAEQLDTIFLINGSYTGGVFTLKPDLQFHYANNVPVVSRVFEPGHPKTFANKSPISFESPVSIREEAIILEGEGDIHFLGPVTLEREGSGFLKSGAISNRLFFDSVLNIASTRVSLAARELNVAAVSIGQSFDSALILVDSEIASISSISLESARKLSLAVTADTLKLDGPNASNLLPRSIISEGDVKLMNRFELTDAGLVAKSISSAGITDTLVVGSNASVSADSLVNLNLLALNGATLARLGFAPSLTVTGETFLGSKSRFNSVNVQREGSITLQDTLSVSHLWLDGRMSTAPPETAILSIASNFYGGTEGEVQRIEIVFEESFDKFEYSETTVFKEIQILSSSRDGMVQGTAPFPPLSVERGRLRFNNNANSVSFDSISIAEGILEIASTEIYLNGGLNVLGNGQIVIPNNSNLYVSGSLDVGNNEVDFSSCYLIIDNSSETFIEDNSLLVVKTLVVADDNSDLQIKGHLRVRGDVLLDAGEVIFSSRGVLSIGGDLIRKQAIFESTGGGKIIMSPEIGTSTTVSGFESTGFPSLEINGDVFFADLVVTIFGDMIVSGGSIRGVNDLSLRTQGDFVQISGNIDFSHSFVTIAGNWYGEAGTVISQGTKYSLQQNVNISGQEFEGMIESITWYGHDFESRYSISTSDFHIFSEASSDGLKTIRLISPLFVSDILQVDSSVNLHIPADPIILSDATVINNGRISGSGGLLFKGTGGTLGGSLLPEQMTVALNGDNNSVLVATDNFTIHNTDFIRGGLNAAGSSLNFAPESIVRVFLDAELDSNLQKRFFLNYSTSTGTPSFHFSGSVRKDYVPEFLSRFDLLASFTVDVQDFLNTPSVYGLVLPGDLHLSGAFSVSKTTNIKCDCSVSLSGSDIQHDIYGNLTGVPSLSISGNAYVLKSDSLTVFDKLNLTGSGVIDNSFRVDKLSIRSSNLVFEGSIKDDIVVEDTLLISRSTLMLREFGFSLNGTALVISNTELSSFSEATISLDCNCLAEITNSVLEDLTGNGYLLKNRGKLRISSDTAIPSLYTGPNSSLTLLSDLTIEQRLVLEGAIVYTLGHSFSTTSTHIAVNGATRFVGDSDSLSGRLYLTGETLIDFHGVVYLDTYRLETHSANINIVASEGILECGFRGTNSSFTAVLTVINLNKCYIDVETNLSPGIFLSHSHIGSDKQYPSPQALGSMPAIIPAIVTDREGYLSLKSVSGTAFTYEGYTQINNLSLSGEIQLYQVKDGEAVVNSRLDIHPSGGIIDFSSGQSFSTSPDAHIRRWANGKVAGNINHQGHCSLTYAGVIKVGNMAGNPLLESGPELCGTVSYLHLNVIDESGKPAKIVIMRDIYLDGRLILEQADLDFKYLVDWDDKASVSEHFLPGVYNNKYDDIVFNRAPSRSVYVHKSMQLPGEYSNNATRIEAVKPNINVTLFGSHKPGNISVSSHYASSQFTFKGVTLESRTGIHIDSNVSATGFISSLIAKYISTGSSGSELVGNIMLSAADSVTLRSPVDVLRIDTAGNLTSSASKESTVDMLIFSGGQDTFLNWANLTVNHLTIDIAGNHGLTISKLGDASDFRITGSIQLVSGYLSSENTTLIMPDTWSVQEGATLNAPLVFDFQRGSHLVLDLAYGSPGHSYRVSFNSGSTLPAGTKLSIGKVRQGLVPLEGLPISSSKGILQDIAGDIVVISSSIAFSDDEKFFAAFTPYTDDLRPLHLSNSGWLELQGPTAVSLSSKTAIFGFGTTEPVRNPLSIQVTNTTNSSLRFNDGFTEKKILGISSLPTARYKSLAESSNATINNDRVTLPAMASNSTIFIYKQDGQIYTHAAPRTDNYLTIFSAIDRKTEISATPSEAIILDPFTSHNFGPVGSSLILQTTQEEPSVFNLPETSSDYVGVIYSHDLVTLYNRAGLAVNLPFATKIEVPPQSSENVLQSYPSPFSSQITISVSSADDIIKSIALYDLIGRKVLERTGAYEESRIVLDGSAVETLAPGLYLIRVLTVKGHHYSLLRPKL